MNDDLYEIRLRMLTLSNLINKANYEYYVLNKSTLSDAEYDLMRKELLELEDFAPELILNQSPTQLIGANPDGRFEQVQHPYKLYSLDNALTKDDQDKFLGRTLTLLKLEDNKHGLVLENKVDGLTLNLTYRNGVLKVAATRGDGTTGEDVTVNAALINDIPLNLEGDDIPEYLYIQGEVYITNENFDKINKILINKGKEPYANLRSAASGGLRSLNPVESFQRGLSFTPHNVIGLELDTHTETMVWLQEHGFNLVEESKTYYDIEVIQNHFLTTMDQRETLNYDIDGLVVKVNDKHLQSKIGYTNRVPNWAIAFKFPPKEAITVLKDIIWQVGATGTVNPVGILKTVPCGGVNVSRVNLHNLKEIQRLDLRIGDTVTIIRSGDAIPVLTKAIVDLRDENSKPYKEPKQCPCCNSDLFKILNNETTRLVCTNANCEDMLIQRLVTATSRKGLNIRGLGEMTIARLVKECGIKKVSDLYDLDFDDLVSRKIIGKADAVKLKTTLTNLTVPLNKFIYSLVIPHVGSGIAEVLANLIGSVQKLISIKPEDINSGFNGEVVKESLIDNLSKNELKNEILSLLSKGMIVTDVVKRDKLKNKVYVITGTFKNYSRDYIKSRLNDEGATIVSKVSSNVTDLICGEKPGSKLKEAKALNINVMDSLDLFNLFTELSLEAAQESLKTDENI